LRHLNSLQLDFSLFVIVYSVNDFNLKILYVVMIMDFHSRLYTWLLLRMGRLQLLRQVWRILTNATTVKQNW